MSSEPGDPEVPNVPADEAATKAARAEKREQGRGWAYELQTQAEADGRPFAWFEALYARADGDGGFVPWEQAAPRFKLAEWLSAHPGDGRRAIDVGCGLGDNARLLADAGYRVTAFDISHSAVDWARQRQADDRIDFQTADLFHPPDAWIGGFDLVHETYNLQAMPPAHLDDAVAAVARLVKPGGQLLVLTRVTQPGVAAPEGPPWPLSEQTLARFTTLGLVEEAREAFEDQRDPPIAHTLRLFRRG